MAPEAAIKYEVMALANEPMPPETRLRANKVRAALGNFDADALIAHLSELGPSSEVFDAALRLIASERGVVFAYANAKKQSSRDDFLAALASWAQDALGESAAAKVKDLCTLIHRAEEGYRLILKSREETEFAKLDPDTRSWAAIGSAYWQYNEVARGIAKLAQNRTYGLPQTIALRTSEGHPYSPDGMIEASVFALGSTLIMESRLKGTMAGDKIVLPTPVKIDVATLQKASENELLAANWRAWKTLEERARFFGGRIDLLDASTNADGMPNDVSQLYALEGEEDWFNFAAIARTNDLFAQNYGQMIRIEDARAMASSITGTVPLAPDGYVSGEEVVAISALSESLGFDIHDDDTTYEGLRLIEWLRGLCALSALAELDYTDKGLKNDPIILPDQDYHDLLTRVGLTSVQATTFIEAVTFGKASRDLFDAPLIQVGDTRKLLVAPATLGQNHAFIVVSLLSARNHVFEAKGAAFEQHVLAFFKKRGRNARSIKFTRDGEEYEIDASFHWGRYLFVFECKNKALPRRVPAQALHFAREVEEDADQVLRLVEALRKWPEVLAPFKLDLAETEIVPIVLNNLGYARSGDVRGVHFADFSAVGRFFQSAHINVRHLHLGILQDIPTVRIWAGDVPTPEDFIAELKDPIQLRVLRYHTQSIRPRFRLYKNVWARTMDFEREELTPKTLTDFAGIPYAKVRTKLEKARKRARKLSIREKHPRKRRR